jgi:hypothetical protein
MGERARKGVKKKIQRYQVSVGQLAPELLYLADGCAAGDPCGKSYRILPDTLLHPGGHSLAESSFGVPELILRFGSRTFYAPAL